MKKKQGIAASAVNEIVRWVVAFGISLVVLALCMFAFEKKETAGFVEAPVAQKESGLITAQEWSEVLPLQAESYFATGENTYILDYLEEDPYLVDLYEGFGFAKEYGSARGHEYCLDDLYHTARPHPLANCLTCKTADFTKLVQDMGVEAYSLEFDSVTDMMSEDVGCYNCHGNDAGNNGELVVTHDYMIEGLGANIGSIAPETLSCGQCHIEYYFVPETKATMIPYDSITAMGPDEILAYYDEMGFSDWTQESTGTGLLKAQHPEMETFLGVGSKHANLGMNCADCHMAKKDDYTSHELLSPLDSPELLASCAECHAGVDMEKKVRDIQEEVVEREKEIGFALVELKNKLVEANASGDYTEEELNAIRKCYRSAQWYFDYDYVENAEGAHNSQLAHYCLDKAVEHMEAGLDLFK